jgi:hypothetical protein
LISSWTLKPGYTIGAGISVPTRRGVRRTPPAAAPPFADAPGDVARDRDTQLPRPRDDCRVRLRRKGLIDFDERRTGGND